MSDQRGRIRFIDAGVTYPGGTVGMKDMNLEIEPGEFVVIVGSSGAGKSTLLRAVNGLNRLTSGSVEVDGETVSQREGRELRALRKRVGMIFQDFRLVKRLSVINNVLIGRLAHVPGWRTMFNLWPQHDRDIAIRALERVGIPEKAWVRASTLSGGQQQRVGIARALAQEPAIILADEPVASLDPVTTHQIMRDLVRINRELGITTLVNLHFLDLAREYGKRIIGLKHGELVYDGSAKTVTDEDFRDIYGREFTEDDLLEEQQE
ncbi:MULTISPECIES: phosphonate ABC transporter ATP-binding protein [unclassified Wenzhouxiangella]|uniref:phosphonate ABC transporter ATP-binding protein n=1 Tax=unclassified Wenzhouxiangella TaxID=2613841 RepID=UPI000E3251F0|nr:MULTISPECIES: phosphonate ABC transporter ATP-binding protein [unclassified Wenzhouxiangella]RFF28123.1 phosphonate ABC transporter ATP-binding protein [Wenzhouxiangella sp. 15181]RFP68080.1 phosphonate ABC transporter ATP-binding protein [Wenzhouxiangella sp. 15190]